MNFMRRLSIHPLLLPVLLLGAGALGHVVIQDAGGASEKASVSLKDLRNFSEAFALIKNQYVDEVDDGTLIRNAMRGMASKLDPYTTYLDHEEMDEWEVSTSGEFGGLGIVVTKKQDLGGIQVVSPIDDTPAQKAGIRSGDLIIKLGERSTHDVTLHDAVQIMRGKPGTDLMLTLVREGVEEPLEITITRALIKIKSVRSTMLEPGYGYVRISNFQTRTSADFTEHVEKLQREADGNLHGIVLDLRNNPGGLFTAAVEIADTLLDYQLPIVSTRGRVPSANTQEVADHADLLIGVSIVALINDGSASASEIVAGALQDNQRAQLLGTRSFGKGSVQTLVPMKSQNAALKLTTARYYTPSGRSIHEKGIEPDYVVELEAPETADEETPRDPNEIVRDNQIEAALELLKTGELDLPIIREASAS